MLFNLGLTVLTPVTFTHKLVIYLQAHRSVLDYAMNIKSKHFKNMLLEMGKIASSFWKRHIHNLISEREGWIQK